MREGMTGGRYPWAESETSLVVALDQQSAVWDVSPALAELLGYPREDLIGLSIDKVVHPDDLDATATAVLDAYVGDEASGRGPAQVIRVLHADGSARSVMTTTQAAPHPADPSVLVVLIEDVSTDEAMSEQLRAHLRLAALIYDIARLRRGASDVGQHPSELGLAALGVFLRAHRVEWWSQSRGSAPLLLGSWVEPSLRSTAFVGEFPVSGDALDDLIAMGLAASGTVLDSDSRTRAFLAATSGRDEHLTGVICVYGDPQRVWDDVERRGIGSVEGMLTAVEEPAAGDAPAHRIDRADLLAREEALLTALFDEVTMGVVTFSADRVVKRMNSVAAKVLGPIEGKHLHNLTLAPAAKEELNVTFDSGERGRFEWRVGLATLTSTVVPRFTRSRLDEVTWLFQQAGGGTDGATAHELAVSAQLRDLVVDEQIELRYQPEVDASTGHLTAFEALAVATLDGVKLDAGAFVPIAVESGLITEIDRLTMSMAVRQAAAWKAAGWDDTTIRFNASALTLADQAYSTRLERELRRVGLHGRHLCVELTESEESDDGAAIGRTMRFVGDLDVGLAIDDFGAAQATFARLSEYEVDVLKLDGQFAAAAMRSGRTRTVIDRTIRLAHDLGCVVVAEGIETEPQRQLMTDLGADRLQGFLIGRSMDPADIDIEQIMSRSLL